MSLSPEEIDSLNAQYHAWAKRARTNMRNRGKASYSFRQGRVFRLRHTRNYGLIEGIGFRFPRHYVFVEQGVFGGLSKQEAIAQGKLRPKPWHDPAIDHMFPQLQSIIEKSHGQFAINRIRAILDPNSP